MNRPQYLPTHDHFYGHVANNPSVLLTVAQEYGADTEISYDDFPDAKQKRTIIIAEPEPYFSASPLQFILTAIPSMEDKEPFVQKETEPLQVRQMEFESPDGGRWWDIQLKVDKPTYELTAKWQPVSKGELELSGFTVSVTELEDRTHIEAQLERLKERYLKRSSLHSLEFRESLDTITENIQSVWSDASKWTETTTLQRPPLNFNIEYKVSLEELNIEQTIRQIKSRTAEGIPVLATFDTRFQKYESVLENEGVLLVIFSDELRKDIQARFDETADTSLSKYSEA